MKSSGNWKVETIPSTPSSSANCKTILRELNLPHILQNGSKLLASTGQEYSLPLNKFDIAQAKKDAASKLGLGFLDTDETFGFNVEEELNPVKEESLSVKEESRPSTPLEYTAQSALVSTPVEDENQPGLSARERNRLKRKRKLGQIPSNQNKIRAVEPQLQQPSQPQIKAEPMEDIKPSLDDKNQSLVVDPKAKAVEKAAQLESSKSSSKLLERPHGHYPFGGLADVLSLDLLSSSWEVRHGSAVGLRELFKVQGECGGMKVDFKPQENFENHTIWCENMAANLICVLALDRFGDFISDQVVAPVRETASQTLASLLRHTPDQSVEIVHSLLHSMIYQSHCSKDLHSPARKGDPHFIWEVRHAALLGLKYFVAVKKDLLSNLDNGILKKVVDSTILGLADADDDVRSVAAATLLPIVDLVVHLLFETVPSILDAIWESLTQLKDDLCSSTSGVMGLLSQFIGYDSVMDLLLYPKNSTRPPLPNLISRLYPFFRHTIASVRLAVVNTLLTFMDISALPKNWIDESFLRFVYQNVVLEERNDIRSSSLKLFHAAIDNIKPEDIPNYLFNHLQGWFAIVMTPIGLPMETSFFLKSTGIHSQNITQVGHNVDKNVMMQDLSLVSVENILKGRYAAINGIARILTLWPIESQELSFCGLIPAYINSTYALHQQLASTLVEEWAAFSNERKINLKDNKFAVSLSEQLTNILVTDVPATYSEMALVLTQIRSECQIVYSSFINDGKVSKDIIPSIPSEVDPTGSIEGAFSLSIAELLVGSQYEEIVRNVSSRKKNMIQMIDDRRKKVQSTILFYKTRKDRYDTQVYSAIAAAVVALKALPQKLNPVIRSIMNSVKVSSQIIQFKLNNLVL